jgi:translin
MSQWHALGPISEGLRAEFTARTSVRDAAITRSRELIRYCAECIRAVHRREWDAADAKLVLVTQAADDLRALVAQYPELYHSGYTQDALKEVVEAHVMNAIIRALPLPTPADLAVPASTYINGLAEAATELRRFILDIMRRDDSDSAEAERLLSWMDAIYDELVTFDFPDAITGDLRRRTDTVRGVLERTRGDLTTSLREERLRAALEAFEGRLG